MSLLNEAEMCIGLLKTRFSLSDSLNKGYFYNVILLRCWKYYAHSSRTNLTALVPISNYLAIINQNFANSFCTHTFTTSIQ